MGTQDRSQGGGPRTLLAHGYGPAPGPTPTPVPGDPDSTPGVTELGGGDPRLSPTIGPGGLTVAAVGDQTFAGVRSPRERTRVTPGRQIPGTPYRVVRLLGEGGMGSVYEAEHVDIGRRVAVKILHPEYCQYPAVVQMFRDEARAASRIGSSYIIDVLDFDELADGRVLFVMELLEARTLGEEARDGLVDPARLIGILRQVCKGLGAAHAAGIVHRDVKPDNIMLVARDGRTDRVKLVDFGIALVTGEGSASENQPVGTLEFMAPEQAVGLPVDGRSDVYSLGCTAYAVLAGRPPFKSKGMAELLALKVEEAVPAMGEVAPDHRCPPALEKAILRALANDPKARYQDVADFEAALCEAQIEAGLVTPWDDLPLPEVDPQRRDRLLRNMPEKAPTRPAPRRLGWAVGAAVLVGAGVIGAGLMGAEEPAPVARGGRDPVELLVDAARAAGARAYYVYPPREDRGFETAYRAVLELEAMEGELAEPGREAAIRARAEFAATLTRLGDHYWDQEGGKPFASDYYIQAVLFGADEPRLRERAPFTSGELADLRRRAASGDFADAELDAAETLLVLAQVEEAPAEQKRERLAGLAERRGRPRRSGSQAALDDLLRGQGVVAARTAEPATVTGGGGGSPAGSEETAAYDPEIVTEAAESDAKNPAGSPRPPAPTKTPSARYAESRALVDQAEAALQAGKTNEASTLLHRAVDMDPNNAGALIALADIHFDRGEYRSAIRFAERAIRVKPRNAAYRVKLGDALYKELQYSEALAAYREADRLGSPSAAAKIAKVEKGLGK